MAAFVKLLTDFFVLYLIVRFFSGHQTFALLVTGTLALLLIAFTIPQVSKEAANAVLTPDKPQVIAHRGGAFDAPENTIAAFRNAKKNGADGIELDVEFTSDWVAVVIHDDTVDRTTDGTGTVHKMTYQQIQSLDASAKYPNREKFPNEKIPTLEEALVECMKLDMKIYIDVKGYAQASAKVLSELFKKYPALYSSAAVCSFYPEVIYLVRRADPNIVTGLTHRPQFLATMKSEKPSSYMWTDWFGPVFDEFRDWSLYTWLWYFCGNSFFLARNDLISRNYKEEWAQKGIQLVAWNVNDDKEKHFFLQKLGISYLADSINHKQS